MDWSRVEAWWGDDRLVDESDILSNVRIARETILAPTTGLGITAGAIHPFPIESRACAGPGTGLGRRHVRRAAGASACPRMTAGRPVFDLILLGMGGDGHILSAFPGGAALDPSAAMVLDVPAPTHIEPRVPRVTIHTRLVTAARHVLVMCPGAAKAERVAEVLEGPLDPDRLPAQMARGRQRDLDPRPRRGDRAGPGAGLDGRSGVARAMRTVDLDGVRVSAIGLGTWQFGSREWGYGPSTRTRVAPAIVRRALELGVTFIDTAEIYGFGASERIIGRTLAADRATDGSRAIAAMQAPFLATKLMPILPIPAIARRSASASRRRLQTEAIDLYQLHWPNPFVPVEHPGAGPADDPRPGHRAAGRGEQPLARSLASHRASAGAAGRLEPGPLQPPRRRPRVERSCPTPVTMVASSSPTARSARASWPAPTSAPARAICVASVGSSARAGFDARRRCARRWQTSPPPTGRRRRRWRWPGSCRTATSSPSPALTRWRSSRRTRRPVTWT